MIKISVIIPVYNAEHYLPECLNSVLKQSLNEIEIICVDDGSKDASLEILNQYACNDNRIKILQQKNQYAGVARNNGMKIAKGKYVAFLDADDYYLEGALLNLYQLAEKNNLDFIKGSFCNLDVTNNFKYTNLYSVNSSVSAFQRYRVLSFEQIPARLLHIADVPWNGLYKKSFLLEHNIVFNFLRCVNDHSFFIHCLLKARRIMITNARVACYRVGQSDSLIGKKALHFECHLQSYKIVRELCNGVEPALAHLILRQELNGLLGWYEQLRPNAPQPKELDRQLTEFLQDYNEEDVAEDFLRTFSYRNLYYRLRYGTCAPGNRHSLPVRIWQCWQEHGWNYTVCRIGNNKLGVKPCN